MAKTNIFQNAVLSVVNDFATRHACVKAVYVFGSVARGETEQANDIDLSAEFLPNCHRDLLYESYIQFQSSWNDWALNASGLLLRHVRWAHVFLDDKNDPAWAAILQAANNPVAIIGKAIMVATPRVKP